MSRRKYTREFKVSAVKLVNEQGYTIPDAARSLGVDPGSARGWLAKFSSEAGLAPKGDGALVAEIQRLRKENARLSMERDILKKAAAFFAREHLLNSTSSSSNYHSFPSRRYARRSRSAVRGTSPGGSGRRAPGLCAATHWLKRSKRSMRSIGWSMAAPGSTGC